MSVEKIHQNNFFIAGILNCLFDDGQLNGLQLVVYRYFEPYIFDSRKYE